jgi:aminoglycoside/choline kinase family phosphotransferase
MGLQDASDRRLAELTRWVCDDLGFAGSRIEPASADASFRRYFRVTRGADTFIVMDAPPDREKLGPYIKVANLLADAGVNVPAVLARNLDQGFLLLSDFGNRQYLSELTAGRQIDRLYDDALAALVKMQTAGPAAAAALPTYDRGLLSAEMELMPEWFLERHLGLTLGAAERALLDRLYEVLIRSALAQPVGFVHRDYHSRNLMLCTADNPGVLDFQDAVMGPLTYDLVSLLKDCYIAWPAARVRAWIARYRELAARGGGLGVAASDAEFVAWFDLMGLQRHIKVLGIFARLYYRDGKSQYLGDLPRVLRYTQTAAAAYPETAELAEFLAARVYPEFERVQARVVS